MRVLIVEDDNALADGLMRTLRQSGYAVDHAESGELALRACAEEHYDLVVLDVSLPGIDGFEVLRQLRRDNHSGSILILTAHDAEADRVRGLDLGADDYVTKPFGVRELLARIHALLRRSEPGTAARAGGDAPFQIGSATIDPKTFQLKRGKAVEELTAKELKLLQLFYAHPGEVLSRDRLLNEVWGYNYYGTTRTLDQVIVQLRKKLGDNGGEPKHLLTVHGVGYKLVL